MNKGQDTVIDDDEETWYADYNPHPLLCLLY